MRTAFEVCAVANEVVGVLGKREALTLAKREVLASEFS
jgi:hypothetical protein